MTTDDVVKTAAEIAAKLGVTIDDATIREALAAAERRGWEASQFLLGELTDVVKKHGKSMVTAAVDAVASNAAALVKNIDAELDELARAAEDHVSSHRKAYAKPKVKTKKTKGGK